jgi:hypothetical protein
MNRKPHGEYPETVIKRDTDRFARIASMDDRRLRLGFHPDGHRGRAGRCDLPAQQGGAGYASVLRDLRCDVQTLHGQPPGQRKALIPFVDHCLSEEISGG